MFFQKFENNIFEISWLNFEQYEKNQYKQKEQNQQFSVQSVTW